MILTISKNRAATVRRVFIALVAILSASSRFSAANPLTVAEAIETIRPMTDERMNAVFVSPSGRHYVMLLIRGDVGRDGLWSELISGDLASLDAATPRVVARLFTRGLGSTNGLGSIEGSPALTAPSHNVPKWLDDDHVVFLWDNSNGANQLVLVQLSTGAVKYLTDERNDVLGFGVGSNGTVSYDVLQSVDNEAAAKGLQDGFSVQSPDAIALLGGYGDGTSSIDFGMCKRFVLRVSGDTGRAIPIENSRIFCQLSFFSYFGKASPTLFSPDGSKVLINVTTSTAPSDWRAYKDQSLQTFIKQHRDSPHSLYAQVLNSLAVADTRTGVSSPLWNAPQFSIQSPPIPNFAWSPDSRSIVIGPTFLPPRTLSEQGLSGLAVAQVNISNGQFVQLPILSEDALSLISIRWNSPAGVELELRSGERLSFRKDAARWKLIGRTSARVNARLAQPIQVGLRQDMNTPPALFARDLVSGSEKMVFDLNPTKRESLSSGTVKIVHWFDSASRPWTGRLYYPVGYVTDKRYPLIVQTHGYAPLDQFSIYGGGDIDGIALGPGWSVYLASILAHHGFAVLQVGGADSTTVNQPPAPVASRYEGFVDGLETGIQYLVREGLVDSNRVGLMGHSATGRLVEFALFSSDFPFAAAIASDYADNNYLQAALSGWPIDDESENPPFGAGLVSWLDNSPAFNVERIQTPLQIVLMSSSKGFSNLLTGWETFSRLRNLRRPVEYYVIPDIQHGSHILQNPRQLLAVQTRALDWWRFWLQGEEDSDVKKQPQYMRWRELRKLHEAVMRHPRAPRPRWTVSTP